MNLESGLCFPKTQPTFSEIIKSESNKQTGVVTSHYLFLLDRIIKNDDHSFHLKFFDKKKPLIIFSRIKNNLFSIQKIFNRKTLNHRKRWKPLPTAHITRFCLTSMKFH